MELSNAHLGFRTIKDFFPYRLFPDLIVSRHLIVAKRGRDPNFGKRGLISPITLPQRKPRRATNPKSVKKTFSSLWRPPLLCTQGSHFLTFFRQFCSKHGHYVYFWSEETDITGQIFLILINLDCLAILGRPSTLPPFCCD